METATDFRIAYVSVNSIELATHISRILVSEHLAACCSLIQNTLAFFQWENSITERYETIIMIKTHKDKVDELTKRVSELHHDRIPEIITVSMQESSVPYLKWMKTVFFAE
ncbi:divalent-cation tolerance protein CutA [Candidatus Kapaibacterium sp.]